MAVAARSPDRAKLYAREHDIPTACASYEELLARDDVDVVYVGIPPHLHREWAIRALDAGKSVLCEKPFAMNSGEAREMVAAADGRGLRLLEAFHYRFHPVLRRAFDMVHSGALGRPTRIRADFKAPVPKSLHAWRWQAQHGGGALMDLGCYTVHVARTLCRSEPRVTAARFEMENGVDRDFTALLRFPNGTEAQIGASMAAPLRAQLRVEGERGWLEIDNYIAPQLGCRFVSCLNDRLVEESADGPSSFAAQLEHVVGVMNGSARPLTGGADATANMDLLDRIREWHPNGRRPHPTAGASP